MEIIEEGIGILVGTQKDRIIETACQVIDQGYALDEMRNICGRPGVSSNILEEIKKFYQARNKNG